MKAILFSGLSMMDQSSVRESLIRIPEVLSRIKTAQKTIDQLTHSSIELVNCMLDDDQTFIENCKVRRVLVNLVQLGLYDRHVKGNEKPKYFVGSLSNLSAIEHCLGFSYIDEFVRSVWFQDLANDEGEGTPLSDSKYQDIQVVQMMNRRPTQFYIYEFNQLSLEMSESKKIDEADSADKLIVRLIKKHDVKQIVNLGPADLMLDPIMNPFHLEDIHIYNTIEIDPMLNWFYSRLAC
jgi:hypothetical protein